MGRKVKAVDVAREAGVSASTVDRVLNGRGGVSSDKERRVYAAARHLKLDRALESRSARTLRVAAFLLPSPNPFHAALKGAIDAQNKGPNPFNIQTKVFHVDPAKSRRYLDDLGRIAGDYDALMVCLPHSGALADLLDHIGASGRPVVTLATDIGATRATYVGPDNYQSGRLAGDLVGRLMGTDGGEVLLVVGFLSMTGQAERRLGFEEVLSDRHPACRIVEICESKDDGPIAGDLVHAALKRHPAVRGIYNAAAGAEPIVEVLTRLGRARDVVFVTHELTDQRRALLRGGQIDAVIDQDPVLEVAVALRAIAAAYGRAEVTSSATETPVRIVMRENC